MESRGRPAPPTSQTQIDHEKISNNNDGSSLGRGSPRIRNRRMGCLNPIAIADGWTPRRRVNRSSSLMRRLSLLTTFIAGLFTGFQWSTGGQLQPVAEQCDAMPHLLWRMSKHLTAPVEHKARRSQHRSSGPRPKKSKSQLLRAEGSSLAPHRLRSSVQSYRIRQMSEQRRRTTWNDGVDPFCAVHFFAV